MIFISDLKGAVKRQKKRGEIEGIHRYEQEGVKESGARS